MLDWSNKLLEFYQRLTTPEPLSVALFFVGLFCIFTALGMTEGINLKFVKVAAPARFRSRLIWASIGILIVIVGAGYSIRNPVYKPEFRKARIYAPVDVNFDQAKKVAADGADVYYLLQSGNIYLWNAGSSRLIDSGTNTTDIQTAGGKLWILKNSGNIYSYVKVSEGAKLDNGDDLFDFVDEGTNTKQIFSVGDELYILKEDGAIWLYSPLLAEKDADKFRKLKIDVEIDGNIDMMAGTASILYFKLTDGTIWRHIPSELEEKYSLTMIYSGEPVSDILASGSILYIVKSSDKSLWRYEEDELHLISGKAEARKFVENFDTLFFLSSDGEIYRYSTETKLVENLHNLSGTYLDISVGGRNLFAVSADGNIYKFSEFLLKR